MRLERQDESGTEAPSAGRRVIGQPVSRGAVDREAVDPVAFHGAVDSFDHLRLAALEAAVTAAGSLIIGLALAEGRLDAAAASRVSQLDESFQAERWGEDPESMRSRAERRRSLEAAATVFAASGS